jgi:hypothetical protein
MAIKYVFKDRPLVIANADKADPQIIGTEIDKIAKANGGRLKPEYVWKAAQSPRHPLHKHYEWDVKTAAEMHWTSVSRVLIRCVDIAPDEDGETPEPAFVSVTDNDGAAYRTIGEIKRSAELSLAVLSKAKADLLAFQRRYAQLQDICRVMQQAIDQISEMEAEAKTAGKRKKSPPEDRVGA